MAGVIDSIGKNPDGLKSSDPVAILLCMECLGIGDHAVRRAGIQSNEYVLVIGAGPIGLGTMQFAKAEGAKVIAMDLIHDRLSFCKQELGVDFTINAASEAKTALAEITAGDFPTVVMDASGNSESMGNALNYLSHGGRLVFIGLFIGDFRLNDPEFHKREATLLSSRNATRADFLHVIDLMKKGTVKAKPLITHRADFMNLSVEFPKWIHPQSGVIKAIVDV